MPHSRPLTPEEARQALALAIGESVTQWARPTPHTASPILLHGIDCRLPLGPRPNRRHTDAAGDNGTVRAVGTVNSRAVLTGGHILQGSSWALVAAQERPRRMPWSYYLSHPGTVHPIGRLEPERLAVGFLQAESRRDRAGLLDTAAIARHSIRDVLNRPLLDRRPPIRTGFTRLRWAAIAGPGVDRTIAFRLVDGERRRLNLTAGLVGIEEIASACEDLAVHDWLLTTVVSRIALARIGEDRRHTLHALQPVVDHLTHLWSPGARTSGDLHFLWDALEETPGLSHQWTTMTTRVREQVSFGAADLAETLLTFIEQNPQLGHNHGH